MLVDYLLKNDKLLNLMIPIEINIHHYSETRRHCLYDELEETEYHK